MNTSWPSRITSARLWIISMRDDGAPRDHDAPLGLAYLATALYALHPIGSDAVERMTVDESWRLYVNVDWLAVTDVPEVGRELVHLLWHLLDDHAARARACGVNADSARRWCVSADAAIAEFLTPAGALPRSIPGRRPLRTSVPAELRYARAKRIPDDVETTERRDVCGSGADGVPRSYEPRDSGDLPSVTRLDQSVLRRAVAAEVLAQDGSSGVGVADAKVQRWARTACTPRIPWRTVFAQAVRRVVATTAGTGDYSYRRPSRRASAMPKVLFPSQIRVVPEIAVVVDTSGSMNDRLLGIAIAELDSILVSSGASARGLTAISVDTTAVSRRVRSAADIDLLGGGGTDMSVGIAVAAQLRPRPELVVVFTDGFTPWPSDAVPGMTVIAALVGSNGADALPPTPGWLVRVECTEEY